MTEGDDLVVGTEGQDTLEGLGGNDTLQGLGGNDVLRGGEGNDLLEAGDDFDQLIGGPGNDTIIGGGGINRLDYKSEGGPNGIVLNLASGLVTDTFGFTDTVSNIQQVYGPAIGSLLIGSDSNESIHGDNGADTIQAGAGNDSLRGYRGNDTIQGGDGHDSINGGDGDDLIEGGDGHDNLAGAQGNDTIDGGAGINIANYQTGGALGSITVNLATGVATDSYGDTDTLINIQHVYGKYNENNDITGDDQDNSIRGHDADDTLAGGGGDDELLGFDGNDSLLGGPGDDELLGGRGDDFFDGGAGAGDTAYFRNDTDYANNGPGVIVDLAAGTATDGFGGSDTLIGIENVVGTEVADQLSGDENDNDLTAFGGNDLLLGRGGNDFLWGMDGDDTLQGGDGNDELWGFSGDDTLEGGDGIDTATYSYLPTDFSAEIIGEQIILTGPESEGVDTITGVERFHFFRQGIALDLDGNAGDIAKLLGVVLGSEWYNQDYISIGLDILDNSNISFEQLMEQALDFILGSEPDNTEVVELIYTNLIGSAPTEGDLNYFASLIEDGTYTQVSMAVEAANHELNLENINLVGLMETGLAFTPLEWI